MKTDLNNLFGNKGIRTKMTNIISLLLLFSESFLLILLLFALIFVPESTKTDEERIVLAVFCGIALVAFLTTLIVFISSNIIRKNKDTKKLTRLIQYSRRRDEIEEEIGRLTSELYKTDVGEYLDLNRLAFSGQSSKLSNGVIDYNNFINQFGIRREELEVKKGTALFLTPFDSGGESLYGICQAIMGRLDIFLQKSDNKVSKDDIMMNIVTLIIQSELIIVNLNGRNPNVYYELGIAHAIGKPTILLQKSEYNQDTIGFDIRQKRIILYNDSDELETQLLYQISRLRNKE